MLKSTLCTQVYVSTGVYFNSTGSPEDSALVGHQRTSLDQVLGKGSVYFNSKGCPEDNALVGCQRTSLDQVLDESKIRGRPICIGYL